MISSGPAEDRLAIRELIDSYNDAVMRYNNKCEMVPSNLVAGMFGFQRAELFEIEDEGQREPVKVQF